MGELWFTTFTDIASKPRLNSWYEHQSREQKPIYYLLPSVKWFQAARKLQPGLAFQTFDDLAVLLLKTAKVEFTSITEDDRILFFYEILNRSNHFLSEKELSRTAKAYADSYGQLKRLGLKVEETPAPLADLKEAFYIYEQEYRDERGLFDPENRIYKAIEAAKNLPSFPLSHVVIDGYMDFSPVQYAVIEFLVKSAVPYTIYLPALDMPIIQETVSTLKRIGIHINQETMPVQHPISEKTTVTSATTIEEEVHGVLDAIGKLKEDRYRDFGIVLVNEKSYLPELERISAIKQIPLKRAKKKRLSETNLLPFLHQVLDKKEMETKWEQLPLVDTVTMLCFLPPAVFNEAKDQFIRTGEISRDDIRSIFEATKTFQAGLPEKETMLAYKKLFLEYLNQLTLPSIWRKLIREKTTTKLPRVALEIRAYQRVREILATGIETESSPTSGVKVELNTFKDKLLHQLEEEQLFIDRAPADGVEIYSFRDVPLFKGEHLFVLGLNEGEFPKPFQLNGYFQERYVEAITSPFPLPLSDYFRKKDDASFVLLKYVARTLSFSNVEGMNPNQPLLPSKYLMDESIQVNPAGYSTISRLTSDTFQTAGEYEEKLAYHVGTGKALRQEPPLLRQYRKNIDYLQSGEERISSKWEDKLASARISITGLESYAKCSFKYGLERLLKVQEPLEKQRIVDPIETGNMVHRIVEQFYREAKGLPFKSLASFFQGKDEDRLAAIFEKEWDAIQRNHPEIPLTTLNKAKEDWRKKLSRWLAAERLRFWHNEHLEEMSIFQLEEPVQLNIELDDGKVITLTGKIDRVDIDEHGFVVYDYKSSNKYLDFEQEIPAGVVLQIPLYMMALEHELNQGKYQSKHGSKGAAIGGGYISLKEPHLRKKNMVWKDEEHKARFEPRFKTNIVPLDRDALMETYKFPELIDRLWRGTYTDFSVRPFSASACKYCSYKSICRVTTELQNS